MNSWGDIPLSPVRLFTKAEGRQFVPRPKEKLAAKPDVFVRIGGDDDVDDLDEGGAGHSAKGSHRFQPRLLVERSIVCGERGRQCPLWVKSGHPGQLKECPLCATSEHSVQAARAESQVGNDVTICEISISEEHDIYTDYNGCHRHHVKHHSYPSVHFSTTSFHFLRSGRVNER